MSSRLSKIIRTISTSDRAQTQSGSTAPYEFRDSYDKNPCACTEDSSAPRRSASILQRSWIGADMNILQKAAHHVPGAQPRRDKKDSRDDKHSKDKHKHSASRASPRIEATRAPATLSIEMESPPLVMYGSAAGSTGALMSGQLKITVHEPHFRMDTLQLELIIEQSNKKPVEKQCPDCVTKKTVLRLWKFVSEPTHYSQGVHQFPFSYLFQGHLPASTETPLGSIKYVLQGRAHETPRAGSTSSGSTIDARPGTPVTPDMYTQHVLGLYRAIPPPENDRTAIRVFPPTNLQAICTLPPLIHPITNGFQVLLRLTGVSEHADKGKTVRTWRLKKLTWRLEEQSVVVSQACDKHAHKVGGTGKGIKHENIIVLGGKELREGWKSDYSPPSLKDGDKSSSSGTVEIELTCGPKPQRHDDRRPCCDVDTPSGFTVRHKLIVECVVTEELHPTDKPKWVAPTGVARILRMGYEIRVTERMGLGISWDEEQPPMYEDVPASPPGYIRGQETRLGDDLEPLDPGARPIPGRENSTSSDHGPFEPPPSYADNRMAIADDEEWDVSRVDLSEGVRPSSGSGSDPRSRSRGFSPLGRLSADANPGTSGFRPPNVRPRLDASDFDTDPYDEMIRGRHRSDDGSRLDDVGQQDD